MSKNNQTALEDLLKVQKELETPKEIKRENKLMPLSKPFYDKLMNLLDETFPGNPITKEEKQ